MPISRPTQERRPHHLTEPRLSEEWNPRSGQPPPHPRAAGGGRPGGEGVGRWGTGRRSLGEPGAHRASARFQRRKDRKSTRLNSSHVAISYAVFCLKKKNDNQKLHQ